jgi:TPR repeat protein
LNSGDKAIADFKKAIDYGYKKAIENLEEHYNISYTPQKSASSGGSSQVNPVSLSNSSGSTPPLEKKLSSFEELCIKAEQGDAMAYFKLGEAYEKGDGVQKDIVKAKEWYRKASEQDENSIAKAIGNAKLVVLN